MSGEEHMPLKDEFSGDESDIDMDSKSDTHMKCWRVVNSPKKIRKRTRNFVWKWKWVKIPNCVPNSSAVAIRKWVKVKVDHPQSENQCSPKNANENEIAVVANGQEAEDSPQD